MTINDQIRDKKLQYDINREAKISASSSGKIDKYEYLTGEEILLSNQQQIIERARFTYSPLGKAFQKQIKTIEDQGEKQFEALKDWKPKEQTKPIEGKSNNHSRAEIIFNDLISKRKSISNELYESVDKNKLKFEHVGNTKDVRFYEYMDSKELLNKIRNGKIKFDDVQENQEGFLKKLNEVKIGRKNHEQEEVIANLEKFYRSREDVFNFFRNWTKMMFCSSYKAKQDETKGTGIKILTPK